MRLTENITSWYIVLDRERSVNLLYSSVGRQGTLHGGTLETSGGGVVCVGF